MQSKFIFLLLLFFQSLNLVGQDFNAVISTTCDSLSKKIIASGKRKIAVVDFVNLNTSITELGTFLCEEFSSELANKTNNQANFKVLERTRLEQILKEKELIKYYNNSSAMALELGKISVADILIYATITEFEGYYRVVLKLLDTKDGDALSSYKMNLVKKHSLEELNKNIIVQGRSSTQADNNQVPPPKPQTENPIPTVQEKTTGDICFAHETPALNSGHLTIMLKAGNDSFECGESKGIKTIKISRNQEGCFRDIPHGIYTYIAYYSWYECNNESVVKTESIRFNGEILKIIVK